MPSGERSAAVEPIVSTAENEATQTLTRINGRGAKAYGVQGY